MQDKTRSHDVNRSVHVNCKSDLFYAVGYAHIHQPNQLEVHNLIYDLCAGEMEAFIGIAMRSVIHFQRARILCNAMLCDGV